MKNQWFRVDLPSYGENTKRDVFIKKEINQCHIEHKNAVLGLGVHWFGYRNSLIRILMRHPYS